MARRKKEWWEEPGVDPAMREWNERVNREHKELLARRRAARRNERAAKATARREKKQRNPGGTRCYIAVSWVTHAEGGSQKRFSFSPAGWQAAVKSARSIAKRKRVVASLDIYCQPRVSSKGRVGRGGQVVLGQCRPTGGCELSEKQPWRNRSSKSLAGTKRRARSRR